MFVCGAVITYRIRKGREVDLLIDMDE